MMMSGGATSVGSGLINERNSKRTGISFAASSKKRKADPSKRYNIDKIKGKSLKTMPEEFHYKPKVSETFLEGWLDFPVDQNVSVMFNSFKMWMVWLVWTNKSMAGLDPSDTSIRARVCSQISVLGTAAGLFLVIAIAGFLVPPELKHEEDKIWQDVFGCLMFTASLALIFYIGVALTAFYPLIESLRDDVAFDAFENYQNRVGGFEVYLFFVGMQCVTIALLVAAKILYSDTALYVMFGITVLVLSSVTYLSRQIFLALDPISSMHMGLSNDPEEQYRAELMSHFILRKIPNTITEECEEIFHKGRESQKLQQTRKSLQLSAAATAQILQHVDMDGPAGTMKPFTTELDSKGDVEIIKSDTSKVQHFDEQAGKVEGNDNEVIDLENATVPFENKPKPGVVTVKVASQNIAVSSKPAVNASSTAISRANSSKLPVLRELFCGADYPRLGECGLNSADAAAAYALIVQAGCSSTADLVSFLDEHKLYRPCSCNAGLNTSNNNTGSIGQWQSQGHNISSGAASAPQHSAQCSSRVAGAWAEALTSIKVPAFHAVKIIQALRAELK